MGLLIILPTPITFQNLEHFLTYSVMHEALVRIRLNKDSYVLGSGYIKSQEVKEKNDQGTLILTLSGPPLQFS